MKNFLTSLFITLACFSAGAKPAHLKSKVASHYQQPLKGKLYLRASIFRGLNLSWLYLGSDGNFVIDPKNGADPVNLTLERQNNAANVGKFTENGNKINARYDNGKTESWDVNYQNGKLNTIDGLFSSVTTAMPAGYKLTGDYSASTFLSNVGSIQTFTFNPDGTFKLHGMGTINTAQTTAMAQKSTGGNYTIKGNTIYLNYNTGEKSVALIGIYQNSYIVLNNSYFKKS